jgi:hypothetical protein
MNNQPSGKSRIKSMAVIVALLCCVAPTAFALEPLRITLGPHAKKEAQEIAKIRRIPLRWQIIADQPDYPSDDVIVAALTVSDPQLKPPLPAKPAEQDCTATVQDAIDQVVSNANSLAHLQTNYDGQIIVSIVMATGYWRWNDGTIHEEPQPYNFDLPIG